MAKFAELTGKFKARVLINPEHVVSFVGVSERSAPEWAKTEIKFHGCNVLGYVAEPPEEVLARLCYPVSPEPPEGAEGVSPVGEILHDIAVFRRWSETEVDRHTAGADALGRAWELVDEIEDRLKALL